MTCVCFRCCASNGVISVEVHLSKRKSILFDALLESYFTYLENAAACRPTYRITGQIFVTLDKAATTINFFGISSKLNCHSSVSTRPERKDLLGSRSKTKVSSEQISQGVHRIRSLFPFIDYWQLVSSRNGVDEVHCALGFIVVDMVFQISCMENWMTCLWPDSLGAMILYQGKLIGIMMARVFYAFSVVCADM